MKVNIIVEEEEVGSVAADPEWDEDDFSVFIADLELALKEALDIEDNWYLQIEGD